MIAPRKYITANAFRIALETRLKQIAKDEKIDLQRLRRTVAFDRLLARIFQGAQTQWVLNGGYAMELMMKEARTTKDIDLTIENSKRLFHSDISLNETLREELQEQISMDFGLEEYSVKSKRERIRRYRRYVYEAGALEHPEKGQASVIKKDVVEKERKKDFEITRTDRFRCRTRYFSDSGIIGSKEFVFNTYLQFKKLFKSRHEKKPKRVKGLNGIYSLKRLAEA